MANEIYGAENSIVQRRPLDSLDLEIIGALQENGRESFRRIGARLGVAESTVRNRYSRLIGDGVLQVTGVTSPFGVGYGALALVGVQVQGSADAIADGIAARKEATHVVICAGRFDLLVELVCRDNGHLLETVEGIKGLKGVLSTETFMYLDLRKQLHTWGTRQSPRGSS